jgi:hypothetical protein
MRIWVCRLQFLLAFASAVILKSEPRRTHDHILLSHIRDSPQPGGPGSRIYIPQEENGPVIPPGHWVPYSLPPTTRRDRVGLFNPTSTVPLQLTDSQLKIDCLRSLAADRIENKASNSSSIFCAYTVWRWLWYCCAFTQPLPSNACLADSLILAARPRVTKL